MSDTKIEWATKVWNPVTGCTKVSAGCAHCYAERLAQGRLKRQYPDGFGKVTLHPERLNDPLHWRKPQRVFVNSMSDLFHPEVADVTLLQVLAVAALAPRHTFMVLTKRPERMVQKMAAIDSGWIEAAATQTFGDEAGVWVNNWLGGWSKALELPPDGNPLDGSVERWPLPNLWLGVSVEDQAAADERIPLLLQTPAAVQFVSVEPMLGPVEFRPSWLLDYDYTGPGCSVASSSALDWVIVGGESGPHARPSNLEWYRSLVDQCSAAGVPLFVKQLGAWPSSNRHERGWEGLYEAGSTKWSGRYAPYPCLRKRKGNDPSEWPWDLRIQEFPKNGETNV